jgi:hypothetical protein
LHPLAHTLPRLCRDIISDEADDCDKDLAKDYQLRTDGKIAAIPALLKLPKHVLAAEAQVYMPLGSQFGGYQQYTHSST